MKELRDGIKVQYGKKTVKPICPICGEFLELYHQPPRSCDWEEEPPTIRLTFQHPHAHLVQDPDGDWWLFPQILAYDDTELDVYGVRHVPYPPDTIQAYLTAAYNLRAEVVDFAHHLEEVLDEMEREV